MDLRLLNCIISLLFILIILNLVLTDLERKKKNIMIKCDLKNIDEIE